MAGSAPGCHILLPSLFVSRRHARFDQEQGRWRVTDLGSTNGVRVNGFQLAPGQARVLEDQDRIAIPGYVLMFWSPDPLATTRDLGSRESLLSGGRRLKVDEQAHTVSLDGECRVARLSPNEFAFLMQLVRANGGLCPRADLAGAIWGRYADGTPKADDGMVYGVVHALRAQLRRHLGLTDVLVNVRARGYALAIEDRGA
jgi:hypothetical protein